MLKSRRKRVLDRSIDRYAVIVRPITSRTMSLRCPFCNSPVAASLIASRYELPFQQKGVHWISRQPVAVAECRECKAAFNFRIRDSVDESSAEIPLMNPPIEVR